MATLVANMTRWKRERRVPERDVVAFFSADEETDATRGVHWMLAHARHLIDAELCLNTDGGGVELAKSVLPSGLPRSYDWAGLRS